MTIQKRENSKETLDGWKTPENDSSDLADTFSKEALELYNKKRFKEALTLINLSIEKKEDYEFYNTKGLILKELRIYKDSLTAFDKSLEIKPDRHVMLNKANMLYAWANSLNDKNKALNIINDALEITSKLDVDEEKFWYLKGSILDCLGEKIESRRCYLIAENFVDELKILDEQVEMLKSQKGTLITVSGTRFYFGLDPFKKGFVVDLIKEPENEHDSDAIRVEYEGETLGYVANSEFTLIDGVKSASDLKDTKFKKAEVLFIYFDEYVILKLI